MRSCVCLFLHDCVRTLTGVYVSWCFPAVFHHQTISHSKQQQKTFQPLPPALLPIIPCALLSPPPKKKLLITRQRSVIKTHVYTRVSFMDQDLVWGGADTWAQCQPCRAASNRRLFPLPFSGTECCAHLVEAKKTANNAAIQHVISLLPCNRNSVIWRHFEIGQIKAALCTSEWRDRWLKGYVLSELPTRIRVFMHVRGNGEAHLFADGSNGH